MKTSPIERIRLNIFRPAYRATLHLHVSPFSARFKFRRLPKCIISYQIPEMTVGDSGACKETVTGKNGLSFRIFMIPVAKNH